MLTLVFRRGLVLTFAALALALPALADEPTGAPVSEPPPPPGTESAPPPPPEQAAAKDGPKGGPKADSPAADAPAPGPAADPGAPPAAPQAQQPAAPEQAKPQKPAKADKPSKPGKSHSHATVANEAPPAPATQDPAPSQAAPEAGRVDARSIGEPDLSSTPAEQPRPKQSRGGGRTQSKPGRAQRGTDRPKPDTPAASFRKALRAAASAPAGGAAAATSPGAPARAASGSSAKSPAETAEPPQPLPARVFPRPLRRIVEVVPGELWAALGALALLALALAASSWLTARRARRLHAQRQALLQEVGVLQAALLPVVGDDVPASVAYRPADGDRAGGDFYDAFALADGSTGMILGEASPDGREALARTTFIRYTLRAYLEAGLTPREVVKVGSEALAEHLGSGFATVTVAVHDRASGRFTYASAGHVPPVVVGPDAHEPVTACSAPPLGMGEPTGFRQSSFTLTAGSTVCLYTRGVIEARSEGRMIGVGTLHRAAEALPGDAGAEELLERIAASADEIGDDMAVCLVRATDDAPATGARVEELEVDEREVGDSLEHFLRACGVPLAEVPGILREAGEASRREGSATVRVRLNDFRPGVDVVPGNLVRLDERRRAAQI